MHLEFLVEDQSGKVALDLLIPKIVDSTHTYRVSPYRGIGRIPKRLGSNSNAEKRILLDQLPRLLQGFGKTFKGFGVDYAAAVVVVCDLDDKDLGAFLGELNSLLLSCVPKPQAIFCISVEEGEAWFLGEPDAVRTAYPSAKVDVLNRYRYDSICGTWETLADAIHPGGSTSLKSGGPHEVGRTKSEWAREITPHMNPDQNLSPSFQFFRDSLRTLVSS